MKPVIALVAAVGLASVAATIWIGSRLSEEKVTPDPYQAGLHWDEAQRSARGVDCDLSAGRCERPLEAAGARVTLEVEPRPVQSMKDLTFTVSVRRGSLPVTDAEADLSLSMPGMFMGENRVHLVHLGGGVYRGRGVIVRCPSGRRIWSAEVTLRRREPATVAPLSATFTFDVGD
ncbi:MAG TPA: FixH family protein [Anaeromyxobacteraceae bacterium]|nr:FixH family protein [Anaeromyxobacteraceae bacterium]